MTSISSSMSSSSSSSWKHLRHGRRRWRITFRRLFVIGTVVLVSVVVTVMNTNIRFYNLAATINSSGDGSGGPRYFDGDKKPPKRFGESKFVPATGTKQLAQRQVDDNISDRRDGQRQRQDQNHISSSTKSYSATSTKIDKHQLDYLLDPTEWDGSPVVVEEFKLVLFTTPKIATTVWKQLARRMMHYDNWREENLQLPHYPQYNGLRYLYHYSDRNTPSSKGNAEHNGNLTAIPTVDEILTSPVWTRAIFVRDPVERLISAYLDKAVRDDNGWYVKHHCCGFTRKDSRIKSITKPNGTVTVTAEPGSTTISIGGHLRRRLTTVSSSSDNKISDSFRQIMQEEHQKRLAPGLLPGMDLPPYCEKMKNGQNDQSHMGDIDSNNHLQSNNAQQKASLPSSIATSPIPFDVFVFEFLPVCDDPHWRPQSHRLDRGSHEKKKRRQRQNHSSVEIFRSDDVWKYINFIGSFDTLASDSKRLLQKVGAWEKYGAGGWGSNIVNRRGYPRRYKDEKEELFSSSIFESNDASHGTNAKSHVQEIFGTSEPEVQKAVLEFYGEDYDHPLLGPYMNRRLVS